jgi:hypothetical protein
MIPESVLSLDQIDLSDLAFWERPWTEREGAFQLLRAERPLAFFALDGVQLRQLATHFGVRRRARRRPERSWDRMSGRYRAARLWPRGGDCRRGARR